MKRIIISLSAILFLSSCVESILVGSVVTGRIVTREKSLIDTRDDINISSKILKRFSTSGLKVPGNSVDVMVDEKRVLLTGIVSNYKIAKKAVELSWQVEGVREVIDEVQVAKNKSRYNGFRIYSRDALITSQIETRVFFTKDLTTANVKINTVNNVVYLLGLAEDEYEIEKITNLIARIRGVKKVISHIITKDDERRRT